MSINFKQEFKTDFIIMQLKVELTPSSYLKSNESRFQRAKLLNNQLDITEENLLIMHDRYNTHDRLALEVYSNEIFIGYIIKKQNMDDVNEFCFNKDNMENIFIKYYRNTLILNKKLGWGGYRRNINYILETQNIGDLQNTLNVHIACSDGSTLLDAAIWDEDIDLVKKLIYLGVDVNASVNGYPTWYYALTSKIEGMKELVFNSEQKINLSPRVLLHKIIDDIRNSVSEGWQIDKEIDEIKLLMSVGVDIDTQDSIGRTPLCLAVESWNLLEVVELFINAGADINIKNNDDRSPFIIAVAHKNYDYAKLLIDAGANINEYSTDFTPLLIAAQYGSIEIIELLLSKGVDIDALHLKNKSNALHIANKNNQTDVAKLLIDSGINTLVKDITGKLPLDYR